MKRLFHIGGDDLYVKICVILHNCKENDFKIL